MPSISLCLIVKNEESVLKGCLDSFQGVYDELIIVDTGSTDKTVDFAREYTDKVLHFDWIDNFAAARNFSFSQATMDYIMWVDADDTLLPIDRERLLDLKSSLSMDVDYVNMTYVYSSDAYGKPAFYFQRERLVKRSMNFKWVGHVHEYIEVYGNSIQSDIAITHRKQNKAIDSSLVNRNLRIYEVMLEKGEPFSSRDLFYYGNELRNHHRYENSISTYLEFLLREDAWVENQIEACLYLHECYTSIGKTKEAMESLVRTLRYDKARPEACSKMGDILQEQGRYDEAINWYELALSVGQPNSGGFINPSFSTWYPHLGLCVCYWRIGNIRKSIEHNNQAKSYIPNDERVIYNENFFNSL